MSLRAGATALLAALASWVVMELLLGNVGLQRMLSGGLQGFLEQPVAVALACLTAFAVSFALSRAWRLPRSAALPIGVGVAALDLAAAIVAVTIVGELQLSPGDILNSVLVVSLYGVQVVAAAAGAWLGVSFRRSDGSSHRRPVRLIAR